MELAKFKERFPEDIEGYTIDGLRVDGSKVFGFVLKDLSGEKRFILYIGDESYIEPYW